MKRLLVLLLLLGASPALAQTNPNPSFNLINKSAQPIRQLLATPAGRTNFGRNRLTAGAVAPGGSVAIRLLADGNCLYDIRAVFADGSHEDLQRLNTCKTDDVIIGAATAKPADDPSFKLTNRSTQPMIELEATPAGQTRAANLLDTPIPPGTSRDITLARGKGCLFDLRLVLADNKAREKKNADLCKITDLPYP